jgi:hypothetical protein
MAIENMCGAPVVAVQTQRHGFSPGIAARLRFANGARRFVKGGTRELNSYSVALHRQERDFLVAMDPTINAGQLPIPRLRGAFDLDPWFVLVLDDVDGRHPTLPWRQAEVGQALAAIDRVAEVLTPALATIPTVAERHSDTFTGWRILARLPPDRRIDPWWRARVGQLAELEASWMMYARGDTLLHMDVRADNLLYTDDGVVLVDWPHACRGAAFVEPVLFAPSVAMQGGPRPADLLAMSKAARDVDEQALAALVCALAGYFTERSLRPPPPGLPKARAFQAAQGDVARQWLRELL